MVRRTVRLALTTQRPAFALFKLLTPTRVTFAELYLLINVLLTAAMFKRVMAA